MDALSPTHHVAPADDRPLSGRPTRLLLLACLAATIALAATAIWPSLDVAIARALQLPPSSVLQQTLGVLREIFRGAPYPILAGALVLVAVRWKRGRASANDAVRRAIFLTLVLVLGPGLIVNAGLKTYSHRPRPIQTAEAANGDMSFRPFYRFDGACERNCSFSSGEAAGAFWTIAPALLAPVHLRFAATLLALGFGAVVSLSRMALGAHFLSDVAFSALIVLLLTLALRRLLKLA